MKECLLVVAALLRSAATSGEQRRDIYCIERKKKMYWLSSIIFIQV
jgi:hypothetical protein